MRKNLKLVSETWTSDILKQQQNNNSNQILELQKELRVIKAEIHRYDVKIAQMRLEMSKMSANRVIQTSKMAQKTENLTNLLLKEAGLGYLSSGCGGDSTN